MSCLRGSLIFFGFCFVFSSEEDAAVVYQNASYLGMTGAGYVWLVTQQTFSGAARNNLPQGEMSMKC